ncbi:MAG: TDT family transporter [Peptococcaceae bacterium]|nr:TDT family transporter [Peptococcaceae bacterium]
MNTMGQTIKRVPIPLCGVILAMASLGNLLGDVSGDFRLICGGVAFALMAMVVAKLALHPGMVRADLNNPVIASASGTFCMAWMVLSTYLVNVSSRVALGVWLAAIALHLLLMVYFTRKFMWHLQIENVYASYFIVYVGICVAAVTAPSHGREAIGEVAFWFGFAALFVIGALVVYRYARHAVQTDALRPLFCICVAPISLCLTGYAASVPDKSPLMLGGLLVAATLAYAFVLVKAIGYALTLDFYPSFAGMSFPFVVCPLALKQVLAVAEAAGTSLVGLKLLFILETVVALIFVSMVLARFLHYLFLATERQDHCTEKLFLGKIPYQLCDDGLDK